MKLFHAPGSPFVRKVMACAIAREIDRQIAPIPVNPQLSPPELLAANPLSKIPCLLTTDGVALFDSPVICEYLDSIEDGTAPMFPRTGRARWVALKQQAMADGIMDAAVLRRGEGAKPQEPARDALLARQQAAIDRTLDQFERDPPHKAIDIGTISVGCALGYLDFRFASAPWRPSRPNLAAWFEAFSANPCMSRTVPKEA